MQTHSHIPHLAILASALNHIFYEGDSEKRVFSLIEISLLAKLDPSDLLSDTEVMSGLKHWCVKGHIELRGENYGLILILLRPDFSEL